MKLLIVNPNTSEGVTQNIDRAAQSIARKGDSFRTVSAAFGPEVIVTEEDGIAAVDGVVASVEANMQGLDGIVLASFGDTGAEAVRAAYPDIPVVGIASAAFAAAKCLGGKFSIVTFDESLKSGLLASIEKYGVGDSLQRLAAVSDSRSFNAASVQVDRFDAINAMCIECAKEPIVSIVLGGGPLAGLSVKLTSSKIPIIDGTHAAIGVLRSTTGNRRR